VRAKALLLALLLAPAIALGAGAGAAVAVGKGFTAGKYYNRTATIAKLTAADLGNAGRAENIDGLLALASAERRLNLDDPSRLLRTHSAYKEIPYGDRLLLGCLKDPRCDPLACADIARVSDLHREVLLRQPASTLTQVNHAIGDISERVMIRHFESTGWQRIEGQVGRSGFDGLFVKRNADGLVREVLIVESKYNTSTLQSTNHGQQMSRDWVEKKLQNLRERQPDDATYRRVEELVSGGYYRARLWTMRVDKGEIQIDLQRVGSASDKVDYVIEDRGKRVAVPPEVIRISAPKDSFEKTIVDTYQQALGKLGPPQ
jgi:hypothetical protein